MDFRQNATERALHIPELCDFVSSHLCNRDLFRLALTSRAFERPALQQLWCHLTRLTDLLALLPADGAYVTNTPDGCEASLTNL